MLLVIAIFAIIVLSNAQNCLKSNGEPVAWWVIMKIPPKIGNIGFGYYDSTMKTSKFAYYDVMVDVGSTPLTKTEEQINSQNLQYVAWTMKNLMDKQAKAWRTQRDLWPTVSQSHRGSSSPTPSPNTQPSSTVKSIRPLVQLKTSTVSTWLASA